MQLSIPRHFAIDSFTINGFRGMHTVGAITYRMPIYGKTAFLEDWPGSYFYETKGRKFNDCVHSKLMAFGPWTDVMIPTVIGRGYHFVQNHIYERNNSSSMVTQSGWCTTLGNSIAFDSRGHRTSTRKLEASGAMVVYWDVHQSPQSGQQNYFRMRSFTLSWDFIEDTKYRWQVWDGSRSIYQESTTSPPIEFHFSDDFSKMAYDAALGMVSNIERFIQGPVTWRSTLRHYDVADYIYPAEIKEDAFLLHEPQKIQEGVDQLLESRDGAVYWRNWLVQHAYVDALEAAPTMNDNNLQNISEIASFIVNLVIHKRIKIPRRLQDLWLGYRYTYGTGRQDAEEAIEFMHRYADLGSLDGSLKCYGEASTQFKGVDILCRCQLKLKPKKLGKLQSIWRALYTYGLQPNFYVLWDAIPFSFIVDWLLPIGDVAHASDVEEQYSEENYSITDVIFSLEYNWRAPIYGDIHCYSRWASAPIRELNELYWFDKPASSTKTKCFRIADIASLIIK